MAILRESTSAPSQMTQVAQEFQRLRNETTRYAELVDKANQRYSPITVPRISPDEKQPKVVNKPELVPFANELRNLNEALSNTSDMLESLINRAEL